MDDIERLYNKVLHHVTKIFLQRDAETLKKILMTKGKSDNGTVADSSIYKSLQDTPNYPKPIGRELEAMIEKLSAKVVLVTKPGTILVDLKFANRKGIKNKLEIINHE